MNADAAAWDRVFDPAVLPLILRVVDNHPWIIPTTVAGVVACARLPQLFQVYCEQKRLDQRQAEELDVQRSTFEQKYQIRLVAK